MRHVLAYFFPLRVTFKERPRSNLALTLIGPRDGDRYGIFVRLYNRAGETRPLDFPPRRAKKCSPSGPSSHEYSLAFFRSRMRLSRAASLASFARIFFGRGTTGSKHIVRANEVSVVSRGMNISSQIYSSPSAILPVHSVDCPASIGEFSREKIEKRYICARRSTAIYIRIWHRERSGAVYVYIPRSRPRFEAS